MKKITKFLVAIAAAVSFTTFVAAPVAFAEQVAPVAQADDKALVLTPVVWTIITGLIMPFVLALLLKAAANSVLKGVVGIVAAAIVATAERAALADGSAVFTGALLLDIVLIYGPQLLTYLGLWQHVALNRKLAPNVGIG